MYESEDHFSVCGKMIQDCHELPVNIFSFTTTQLFYIHSESSEPTKPEHLNYSVTKPQPGLVKGKMSGSQPENFSFSRVRRAQNSAFQVPDRQWAL